MDETAQPPMLRSVEIRQHQPPPIDERTRLDLSFDERERVAAIHMIAGQSFHVRIAQKNGFPGRGHRQGVLGPRSPEGRVRVLPVGGVHEVDESGGARGVCRRHGLRIPCPVILETR